jgi:hypothetical protein
MTRDETCQPITNFRFPIADWLQVAELEIGNWQLAIRAGGCRFASARSLGFLHRVGFRRAKAKAPKAWRTP